MREKLYSTLSSSEDFSNVDHIIIGSGIGGLTTAAWLAKAGKKVVIFERHYTPGGFTHTFKRNKGFVWDVGVHYVGNMGKNNGVKDLFDFISGHKLKWESLGEVYDVAYVGGKKYEFRAGEKEWKKQMLTHFPKEEEALSKYLSKIKRANKFAKFYFIEKAFKPILSKSLGSFIHYLFKPFSQKTTYQTLRELTDNQQLIAVLCAQCGNYGLSPQKSSFAAHALVTGHFMEGGFFPTGGASEICNTILETINKLGAKLYINACVKEIVVEKNKVVGVRVNDQFIPCKSVISNAGVYTTIHTLISEKSRNKLAYKLGNVTPSTGHMCLYVGLDKSDEELNLPKHNVWSFANNNYDDLLTNITLETAAEKFSYISFPSAKDSSWSNRLPNTATIQALTIGKYEWFKKYEDLAWMKRGDEYKKLKKAFEESMLNRLYELFPQIRGHVVVTEVSTPLSTKHFANYQNGEIYGLAHTPERFTKKYLRPETPITGLRFTGQDITLVGVAGAMLSGLLTAVTIMKHNTWKVFRQMAQDKKEASANI